MVFTGLLVKSLIGRCCLFSGYFNKYWPGRLSVGEELPFQLDFMSSCLTWCNPSWAGTIQWWVLPQIHAESVCIEKWCFGADWEFALQNWRNIQRESSGFCQQSVISLNLLIAELRAVSHKFSSLVGNSVMKFDCLPGNWTTEASLSMLLEFVSKIQLSFNKQPASLYICIVLVIFMIFKIFPQDFGLTFALQSKVREKVRSCPYTCAISVTHAV